MFSCFVFTRDQKRKEKKSSDEESESEDDPVKIQKKRDWDEWKDGRRKVCWLFPRGNQIIQGFGKCYTEARSKILDEILHGPPVCKNVLKAPELSELAASLRKLML